MTIHWRLASACCRTVPLLAYRYVTYSMKKHHYFMLDFCYSVNVLCFAHLFLAPSSTTVFALAFMSSCGPLAWAVIAWRNSLVFHDIDKTTSLFIHIMPPLLMYAQRECREAAGLACQAGRDAP